MAPQQMDAVSSFQHVVDNVPTWRATVAELATYAAKKYEEYAEEYARLVHLTAPKKKKSESICSIRSIDEQTQEPLLAQLQSAAQQPLDLAEISPFEPGSRYLYAQAHRKRKPGTSDRSGASGSTVFNPRQAVVIYYDAHVQKELDTLVKAFGVARNNLRKGKNAYAAANGFQLPNLLRRYGGVEGKYHPSSTSLDPKQRAEAPTRSDNGSPNMETTFAAADKELEVIQNSCERAAHQAIRNGECKMELATSLKNLELLLNLAETTLANLKAEEAKRSTEQSQNTNDTPEFPATLSSAKVLNPVLESLEAAKRPPILPATSTFASSTLAIPSSQIGSDTIEVDDDNDSGSDDLDFKFDISKIRSTRVMSPRSMGSARIVA